MSVRHSIKLPQLGLGGASLGNLYQDIPDATAMGVLETAASNQIRFVDTAPHYGAGLSETRIGTFLDASENEFLVSTKVGRRLVEPKLGQVEDHGFVNANRLNPVFDYSSRGIMDSFEGSCDRLKRDQVDVLLLHDIGIRTHGERHQELFQLACDDAFPTMQSLKEKGAAKAIGIGVNEIRVCQEVLDSVEIDLILLAGRYSLLESEAALELLERCLEKEVQVIIGGPFNSGLLVSEDPKRAHYDYGAAPDWAWRKRDQLKEICNAYNVPLPAAALQFPLAHPAVASVVPGAQTPSEIQQIAEWFAIDIPKGLWRDLQQLGLLAALGPTP